MNCSLSMFLRSLGLLCAVTATHFRLSILQTRWKSPKIGRRSTSWLKRNLLLTVVGTVETRDTSRDMDNVQMISTKITAIKEYLYVRHPHCTAFIASVHLVILRPIEIISWIATSDKHMTNDITTDSWRVNQIRARLIKICPAKLMHLMFASLLRKLELWPTQIIRVHLKEERSSLLWISEFRTDAFADQTHEFRE